MTDYLETKEFLHDFKNGEREAWEAFYNAYWAGLFLFAGKLVGNSDEAKDIAQDAFVILWQEKRDFPVLNNMLGYLYTVVRHDCMDRIRTRQALPERQKKYAELVNGQGAIENAYIEGNVTKNFLQLIGGLDDQQKEVFKLMYFDGLRYQDIADKMGLTMGQVHWLRKTGLDHLRKNIPSAQLALIFALNFAPLMFN